MKTSGSLRCVHLILFWRALVVAAYVLVATSLVACSQSPSTLGQDFRQKTQLKTPLATPAPAPASFTVYALPSSNTYLGGIADGSDHNIWVTEGDANNIAQVTSDGSIKEFPIPTASAYPALIINGPDGNLWFTEYGANNIGRITPTGVITELPYPPPAAAVPGASNAQGIAFGPDGNIWFGWSGYGPACGGDSANAIDVMSPSTGSLIASYSPPTPNAGPEFVVAGPDGNLWFAEDMANKIGRISTSGVITEFPVPTPAPPYCAGSIGGLAVGPDGNIWFTERFSYKVGRITPSGDIAEFGPYATGGYRFNRIAAGPDGNMWFTEKPDAPGSAAIIAKMDTSGNLKAEFSWSNGGPRSITTGPDNNIWYTDEYLNQVGKLTSGVITHVARHP